MAITVKYLEDLGVEKEVAEKIFAERSKEIEADKAKREKLETELKEKKESLDNLSKEFEDLKSSNASAEEYKTKYEALVADNEAKEKQALADKLAKEKEDNNRSMFNKAVEAYGKTPDDWNGKFTEEGYYNEFIKALELEENTGRAHKDILHDLVKNDGTAFKGVQAVKLAGGRPTGTGNGYSSVKEIMSSDMTREQKRQAIAENIAKGNIDNGSRS